MNDYRINNHYAKALLLLAEERGEAERAMEDMRLVAATCKENRQLATLFANPTLPMAKKVGVIEALFGEKVLPSTLLFLCFVARQKRSVNMRGISEAYMNQYRESRGIVVSHLVTHQPVTDEAKENVRKLVADYTGKTVEMDAFTDPKMLGSFKLEFGDMMYDARIRTKIKRLRIAFADNQYESKL